MLNMALTAALLTIQLTSGEIIFDHVYGQIMDTGATGVTLLIFFSHMTCNCNVFFYIAYGTIFELFFCVIYNNFGL